MSLRIACWNLNGCLKKPRQRWKIANLLRLTNADVYCLQEVMRQKDGKWLAKQLECQFSADAWHKGGMCVLSKLPILQTQVLPLVDSYCNALVGMQVRVLAPRQDGEKNLAVWIYSIHLDSRDYLKCEDRRRRELEIILQAINYKQSKSGPVILAGDWNSVDDAGFAAKTCTDQKCALPSKKNDNLPANLLEKASFTDVHDALDVKEPTWLPSQRNERIDRIYVRKQIQPEGAMTVGNGIAKWPTGKDHCMILADVTIVASE